MQVNTPARSAVSDQTACRQVHEVAKEVPDPGPGACVMDMSGKVLAESLSTQLSSRLGGVIPTLAMKWHEERVEGVVIKSVHWAKIGKKTGTFGFFFSHIFTQKWANIIFFGETIGQKCNNK